MRVAVVALTRRKLSGGFRKYMQDLVPPLRAHPDVESVDVFVPPTVTATNGSYTWPAADERRLFRDLRRRVTSLAPDVVLIPTARYLEFDWIPVVSMVRNMEPLEVAFDGNSWSESLKNLGRAAAARWACLRSQRVIAVSEHVRRFLITKWRIPHERVGLVYHGVDTPVEGNAPATATVIGTQPFLFTAGSLRPARGLEDLLEAMEQPQFPPHAAVVIAGAADPGTESYLARLRRKAQRAGVAPRVVWAGQLNRAEMSWCFTNACLFIMTSRAEACPNTVLEALAHGTPSVSTDHPPMPEFFGDNAVYYRAGDAASLTVAISSSMSFDEAKVKTLRAAARRRAGDFTWQKTAAETVAELQRALR